jgi:DNA repair protein RecO (recombination protein O)
LIRKTSAIVLRCTDYRESSRIVTLFTPDEGKVAVMVRSARSPKSKYSGLMQVGNILDVIYYQKSTRSVQSLTDATYREKTFNIQTDYSKLAVALGLLEMTDQLVHSNESNRELYQFVETVLVWLHGAEGEIRNLFPYILIRLADHMGIGLQFEAGYERSAGKIVYLNVNRGSFTEAPQDEVCYRLSGSQSTYINLVFNGKTSILLNHKLDSAELKQLIQHIDVYLKYHIEGLKDRKSDAIFDQINLTP